MNKYIYKFIHSSNETEWTIANSLYEYLHMLFKNNIFFPVEVLFNNGTPTIQYDEETKYLLINLKDLDDDENKYKNKLITKKRTYNDVYDIIFEEKQGKMSLYNCCEIIKDYVNNYGGITDMFDNKLQLEEINLSNISTCETVKVLEPKIHAY